MMQELTPVNGALAETELVKHEERLRALHALRTEARLIAGFEAPYVSFVRALRERLHPRGVRDIRTITLEDGLIVSIDVGDRLGCDVFYGCYEEAFDARIFTASLAPGATVIDIGANFGFYSLLAARPEGPAATVVAFEPDPNALAVLLQNIEVNGLTDRVTAWQMVIGESDGTIDLQLAAESAFTSVRPTGRSEMIGTVTVPMRSLDSFAAEHGISSIDAVKIDAEGFEGPILRGARSLLRASADPLVLLEVSAKNLTDTLQSELTDALDALIADGFVALRPDVRCPQGLRSVRSGTDAAHLTNTNVFLVRAGGEAERRLRAETRRHLSEPDALVSVRATDTDARALHIYRGLDPAVVADALNERDALRQQVEGLRKERVAAEQATDVSAQEVELLRAEISELTAQVAGLSATRQKLRSTAEQSEAVVERQSAEVQALREAQENAKRIIREQAEEIEALQARVSAHDAEVRAARQEARHEVQRKADEVASIRETLTQVEDLMRRQQEEIGALRSSLAQAESAMLRHRDEVAERQRRDTSEEQLRLWRDIVERQDLEMQQLRLANEKAQAQLDDWRSLAERLVTESDDRRERLEEAQRHIFEKRELIDQLWAKLAAARADRDMLQARCTEQMHEIWRLREEHSAQEQAEKAINPARRLG